MSRWAWFAAGAAGVLVFIGGVGGTVIETGAFDARASTQHGPIAAWVTHTTMMNSMRRQAEQVRAPASFTPEQTVEGRRLYEQNCMMCHGGPGVPRADWVQGITPSPPYLVDASRRWTPAQLYWVVKNGVKMTAMPAWSPTKSDAEIWDIVAFVQAMPLIKPADFQRLEAGPSQVQAQTQAAAPKRQAR